MAPPQHFQKRPMDANRSRTRPTPDPSKLARASQSGVFEMRRPIRGSRSVFMPASYGMALWKNRAGGPQPLNSAEDSERTQLFSNRA